MSAKALLGVFAVAAALSGCVQHQAPVTGQGDVMESGSRKVGGDYVEGGGIKSGGDVTFGNKAGGDYVEGGGVKSGGAYVEEGGQIGSNYLDQSTRTETTIHR